MALKLLRNNVRNIISALLVTAAFVGSASADMAQLKFTQGGVDRVIDTLQNGVPSKAITNGKGASFVLVGGVDRIIKATLYSIDANGSTALKKDFPGTLLDPTTTINIGDKQYYGKKYELTGLADGKYKLVAKLMDNQGRSLKEEVIEFVVDTQPPTVGNMVFRGPYKREIRTNNSIERSFGDWNINFDDPGLKWGVASRIEASQLYVGNVTDANRIKSIKFHSYYVDDPLGKIAEAYIAGQKNVQWVPYANLDANYSESERKAYVGTGGYYTVNSKHFPNKRALVKAVFEIQDEAGNITRKEKVFSWYGAPLREAKPEAAYIVTPVDQATKTLPESTTVMVPVKKVVAEYGANKYCKTVSISDCHNKIVSLLLSLYNGQLNPNNWLSFQVAISINRGTGADKLYSQYMSRYPSGMMPKTTGNPEIAEFKKNPKRYALDKYKSFVSKIKSGTSPATLLTGAYAGWIRPVASNSAADWTNSPLVVYRFKKDSFVNHNRIYGIYADWDVMGAPGIPDWEDQNYVYKAVQRSWRSSFLSFPDISPRTDFTWREFGYQLGTLKVINPDYQPPHIKSFTLKLADGTTYTGRYISKKIKDGKRADIQSLSFNVEPRNYTQVIRSRYWGTCEVPAGQTTCAIPLSNLTAKPYPPASPVVGIYHAWNIMAHKKNDTSVQSSYVSINLFWDIEKPIIESATFDNNSKVITAKIKDLHARMLWNTINFEHADITLHKSNGISITYRMQSATNGQLTTAQFDSKSAALPEGVYTKATINAYDKFGNLATEDVNINLSIDNTPPTVMVMNDALKQLTNSETTTQLSELNVKVEDNIDLHPRIVSATFVGGPENFNMTVPVRYDANTDMFKIEYPMLFPSKGIDGTVKPYQITVEATDASGNKSQKTFTLTYIPKTLPLRGDKLTYVPAVSAEFTDGFGDKVIDTPQIMLDDDTYIMGRYRVYGTVSGSSKEPVVLNGVEILPGETKLISKAYDFSATQGRLQISAYPLNGRNAAGKTARIMITTTAPNSPVIQGELKFWKPASEIQVDDGEVVQGLSIAHLAITPKSSSQCRLTLDETKAKKADMIRDPICLVRFYKLPDSMQVMEDDAGNISIEGRLYQSEIVPFDAEVSIFDVNNQEHIMESLHAEQKVLSAYGRVAFELHDGVNGNIAKTVKFAIDNPPYTMLHAGDFSCRPTLLESAAKMDGETRTVAQKTPVCFIDFIDAPPSAEIQHTGGGTLTVSLKGINPVMTKVQLAWNVAMYDNAGNKILLNEQNTVLKVEEPDPIVLDDGIAGRAPEAIEDTRDRQIIEVNGHKVRAVRINSNSGFEDHLDLLGDSAPATVTVWGLGNVETKAKLFRSKTDPVVINGRKYFYKDSFAYPYSSLKMKIWTEMPLFMQAQYDQYPEKLYEQKSNVYLLPNTDIRPIATLNAKEILSDENLPISLDLATIGIASGAYNPAIHGKWGARAVLIGPGGKREPMTPFILIADNGHLRLPLSSNVIQGAIDKMSAADFEEKMQAAIKRREAQGLSKAEAQAKAKEDMKKYRTLKDSNLSWGIDFDVRLEAPKPELSVTKNLAYPVSFVLLPADGVTGDLTAYRVSGPAPFRLMTKLTDITRAEYAVLDAVDWYVSSDEGRSWSKIDMKRARSTVMSTTLDKPGHYLVKAVTHNGKSGKTYTTRTIDVSVYEKPGRITFRSYAYAFTGDSVKVRAVMESKELAVAEDGHKYFKTIVTEGDALKSKYDIQWSTDGINFVHTHSGDSRTVSLDEPGRIKLYVKMTNKRAKPGDRGAVVNGIYNVSFVDPKPPIVQIAGPYQPQIVKRRLPDGTIAETKVNRTFSAIEKGKTYTISANVQLPYRNMKGEVGGHFILPDGSISYEKELSYTPSDEDVQNGMISIRYVGYVKGYEDLGARREVERKVRAWQYVFPEFDMYIRQSAEYAPAYVTAEVRPAGLSGQLDKPQYEWKLPPQAGIVRQSSTGTQVMFEQPGDYVISVIITDARGNKAAVSKTIKLKEPPPLVAEIKYAQSNKYTRAPLDVVMRSYVSGGHPNDRIEQYDYYVDGKLESSSNSYIARTTLNAGMHSLKVVAKSRFGYQAEKEIVLNVAKNKPPVCSMTVSDYRSSWTFRANCKDEDGRIVGYKWTLDGEPVSISSSAISVSKKARTTEPSVMVIGIDDAGDQSAPAHN